MGLLAGKRILVTGVASNRSIAWGVARAMHREGAELAFTFQNERLGERVRKLAAEVGSTLAIGCDVSADGDIDACSTASGTRGRLSTAWSTRSRSLRARRWTETSFPGSTVKRSVSPTT